MNNRRQFLKHMLKGVAGLVGFTLVHPSFASPPQNDLDAFMAFSRIITGERELHPEFGALCWRYVRNHTQPEHRQAMLHFLHKSPSVMDPDLQSIAYHTLSVWYKGNLSSIPHTPQEGKIAYLNALKWKALGIPARGVCVGNWSRACTMS